jgi:hypothetical protein
MNNGPSRKHHFVPRWLLANFTEDYTQQSSLFYLDLISKQIRPCTPASIAYENDLYSIENPNLRSDALEKQFAIIDGEVSNIVRDIISEHDLLTDAKIDTLIWFVGFMIARNPGLLKQIKDSFDNILTMMIKMGFSKTFYEEYIQGDVDESLKKIPYEEMERMIRHPDLRFEFGNNFLMQQLLQIADKALPILRQRAWSLLINESGDPFISSDNPVAVNWTKQMPASIGPGLGMPDTALYFPLSRQVCLYSNLPGINRVAKGIDKEVICCVNMNVAYRATRFLYLKSEDFIWINDRGEIDNVKGFIQMLENSTPSRPENSFKDHFSEF